MCVKLKTVIKLEICVIKTNWKESRGFSLARENIGDNYIFIHFLTPVTAILRGRKEKIMSGGCIIFNAFSQQNFSSPECELVHDWFHADLDFGRLIALYGAECERVYYPDDSKKITALMRRVELECMKKEKFYRELAEKCVEDILIQMVRGEERSEHSPKISYETKKLFEKARVKIHSEYGEEWSVEKMAELTLLSPSRFSAVYRTIYGVAPMSDLISLRIERAKLLLMDDSISVNEAAEKTGYNSQYHFIRQFKEYVGITPGQYKKRNR